MKLFIKGFRVVDSKFHHTDDHPVDPHLLKIAIEKSLNYEDKRDYIESRVDFGRIIGFDNCVPTISRDEIVYITRPRRKGPTRFVVGKDPVPTSWMSVILKRSYDLHNIPYYVLVTAYYGVAPCEDWDDNATKESKEFWKHHALRIELLEK